MHSQGFFPSVFNLNTCPHGRTLSRFRVLTSHTFENTHCNTLPIGFQTLVINRQPWNSLTATESHTPVFCCEPSRLHRPDLRTCTVLSSSAQNCLGSEPTNNASHSSGRRVDPQELLWNDTVWSRETKTIYTPTTSHTARKDILSQLTMWSWKPPMS